tara:strand:- start:563 stop:676 length:114 start_codon:yes stop_codon:yes gene_type:complete
VLSFSIIIERIAKVKKMGRLSLRFSEALITLFVASDN